MVSRTRTPSKSRRDELSQSSSSVWPWPAQTSRGCFRARVRSLRLALLHQRCKLRHRRTLHPVWLKDIARDFKAMNGEWNAWVDPVRNGFEKKTTNVGAVESLLGTAQGCPSRENAQIGGPVNVFAVRSSSIREHAVF